MAGNLLQQLYNTVDGIIVGNFVGETALAAVGTCAPLTMLFTAIALGMSNGAAVVISQFYGAGRMVEMKKTVASSLILLTAMGVVLSVLGAVLTGWLLRTVLGVQAYLQADAEVYFRIYALGLLAQFVYNIVAAILRSMGTAGRPCIFCWWLRCAISCWICWRWCCWAGALWVLLWQRSCPRSSRQWSA